MWRADWTFPGHPAIFANHGTLQSMVWKSEKYVAVAYVDSMIHYEQGRNFVVQRESVARVLRGSVIYGQSHSKMIPSNYLIRFS